MSRSLLDLDEDVRQKALKLLEDCAKQGILLVVTQTYRTAAEQQALYDQGRTKPGPVVTHSPPGYSWHEFRRAFDVAIKKYGGDRTPENWYDGPWETVGAVGEACGLEWAGRWKHPDLPHFQFLAGRDLAAMRAGLA